MPQPRPPATPRLHRIAGDAADPINLWIDGEPARARPGETLLVAVLTARGALRRSEAAAEIRAGFCLMGACQDCWLWLEDGSRLRACTTPAEAGMRVLSEAPPGWPLPLEAGPP